MGSRKKHSTTDSLNLQKEVVNNSLEKKYDVAIVSTDITKYFD